MSGFIMYCVRIVYNSFCFIKLFNYVYRPNSVSYMLVIQGQVKGIAYYLNWQDRGSK